MQVDVHVQWDGNQRGQENTEPAPHSLTKPWRAESYLIPEPTWRLWFQQWFTYLQPDISPIQSYELSLLLTDDPGIQALNASYRNQDRPTDVLAFATLDHPSPPTALWAEIPVELGDIIISVETAANQAQEHHHTLVQEMAWLATHGLLHLLGWDHPDSERLRLMLTQQQQLLKQIFPSTPEQY